MVTALLGGHVEVSFDIVGKWMPHVDAEKVPLLLVSQKVPSLPKTSYHHRIGSITEAC